MTNLLKVGDKVRILDPNKMGLSTHRKNKVVEILAMEGNNGQFLGNESMELWIIGDDSEAWEIIERDGKPYNKDSEEFHKCIKEGLEDAIAGRITPLEALKNDKADNKVPMELLSMDHIEGMLGVFKWARDTKYPDLPDGRPNYYLGHGRKQLAAAAIRHWLAVMDGEDLDPESGFHHVEHAMCCGGMYLKQRALGTLKEDK